TANMRGGDATECGDGRARIACLGSSMMIVVLEQRAWVPGRGGSHAVRFASGPWQGVEVDLRLRPRRRRALEPLVELHSLIEEATVAHVKAAAFHAPGIVGPVAAAGGSIGGEARAGDLVPFAGGVPHPL